VHVNVGRIDQNLDIGEKYGVNLKKGVPALAVLSPTGQSLYGQSGQFSDMRYMQPDSVHAFLSRWKPS
jgi:thioredoxin 1